MGHLKGAGSGRSRPAPVVSGSGNVIGHVIIDGVPYVNGKRAVLDKPKRNRKLELLDGAFSEWRCPECKARLSGKDMICLNACHLSAPSFRRFQEGLAQAAAAVRRRETREEGFKTGKLDIVEALGRMLPDDHPPRQDDDEADGSPG